MSDLTYERAVELANQAREIGDHELEVAALQKAKALRENAQDPIFKGHHFQPDASIIKSTINHPIEAITEQLPAYLEKNIKLAAGAPTYDEVSGFYREPSDQGKVSGAFTLAGLSATGAMPAAPSGFGIVGTVAKPGKPGGGIMDKLLSPVSKNRAAVRKLAEILGPDETPIFPTKEIKVPWDLPDVKPTAAMLRPEDEGIRRIEQIARVARGDLFGKRDIDNSAVVYNALKQHAKPDAETYKLTDLLNARTTPMREAAFEEARKNAFPNGMPQTAKQQQPVSNAIDIDASAMFSNRKNDFADLAPGPMSEHEQLMDNLDRLVKAMESKQSGKGGKQKPPIPAYATKLKDLLDDMREAPGMRSSGDTQKLANRVESILYPENTTRAAYVDPSDMYTLRKELDDALRMKGVSVDEMTNAAKNKRRETAMIKQRVDEGLNDASGGQFKEYTETHKEGMRPIRSAQAMNDVIGTFQNKKPLPGYNVPEITPYALRKAESDQTWVDLGKSGLSDLLNDPARKSMDDSIAVMNAIEMARQGPKGVDNSMTASYLSGLASKALLAGNSKAAFVLRGLAALGESKGSKALNQALLDPMSGNLEKYLKLYGKHALPPDEKNINKLARILTQTSAIQANNKTRDR